MKANSTPNRTPRHPRVLGSRRAKLLTAFVVALVVAGGAMAYLTTAGHGAGTAPAGSAVLQVTFTPGTSSTPLHPGGSGDVDLTVDNSNPFSVHIPSLVLDTSHGSGTGFAVDGGHSGCSVAALGFTAQDNSGSGWTIGADDHSHHIGLPSSISMDTNAASACQGAAFTVYLKVGS